MGAVTVPARPILHNTKDIEPLDGHFGAQASVMNLSDSVDSDTI